MLDATFYKGVFVGLLIAFPTGPVGFLTLRRAYLFGVKSAMYSTAGAVFTDAFYGVVVGFGLKRIANFLIFIAPYASIAAGMILIGIGVRSYFHELDFKHHEGENTPVRDIISTAFLNSLNPTLIFSFTVLFTSMGMHHHVGQPRYIIIFLIGIAAGSFLFWLSVAKAVGYLRKTDREHWVQKANKYTGLALGVIGVMLVILSVVKAIF